MTLATQPLKDAGFTKKQILNVSNKLNITRKNGGMGGGWYWRLQGEDSQSPKTPEDSKDSLSENRNPWNLRLWPRLRMNWLRWNCERTSTNPAGAGFGPGATLGRRQSHDQ